MSVAAVAWAFEQVLPPNEKVVLLALADCENGQSLACMPGQEFLAEKSSMSVRTVQRMLTALEERGLIHRDRRVREGGQRTSDSYVLALRNQPHDNLSGSQANTTTVSGGNLTTVSGTGEPEDRTGSPTPTPSDPLFQAVWNAWPKKVAESTARNEWRKIPKMERETRAEQLILHAKAHAQHTPKEFWPRLSVYIRDTRWNEALPTARAPQRSAGPVRKAPVGVHQNNEWMYG